MRWTTNYVVGLVPLLALACGATPSKDAAAAAQGERAAGAAGPQDVQAKPPSRGAVRGGEPLARKIEWPADDQRDDDALQTLDEASQKAIETSPVPVLIPGASFELSERRLMHGPHWAAFSGKGEGFTVSVHGSGKARVVAGARPKSETEKIGPDTLRKTEALISRNEKIWSATWIENGVAYALELECTPVDGPPCDSAAGIEKWAEGLVYVGGRGKTVAP